MALIWWFSASATKRVPSGATARSLGELKLALVPPAGLLAEPAAEKVPATVLMEQAPGAGVALAEGLAKGGAVASACAANPQLTNLTA
jgi:hypothetical protein